MLVKGRRLVPSFGVLRADRDPGDSPAAMRVVIDSMTMSAPWTRVNFGGAETNQKRLGRKEPNNDHYRMRLSPGLPTNCVCGYRNWGTARAGIAAPRGSGKVLP